MSPSTFFPAGNRYGAIGSTFQHDHHLVAPRYKIRKDQDCPATLEMMRWLPFISFNFLTMFEAGTIFANIFALFFVALSFGSGILATVDLLVL